MIYDLIVIGLGVYGSTLTEEAGKRGLTVFAVDKYAPPHSNGSSHGSSRIFRFTTVEGEDYAKIVQESDVIWKDYNTRLDGRLILPAGLAIISQQNINKQRYHGVDNLTKRASDIAVKHKIDHRMMTGRQFREEFSGLQTSDRDTIFYEPGAYVLRPELAVKAFFDAAAKRPNVEIVTGVEATSVTSTKDKKYVKVIVGEQVVTARQAVLCTGPWRQSKLLGKNVVDAKISPQVTLRVPNPSKSSKNSFDIPGFVYLQPGVPLLYGLPPLDGLDEFKLGIEQDEFTIDSPDNFPDKDQFIEKCTARIKEAAHRIMPELNLDNAEADLCYYTVTSTSKHVIANLPEMPNVTVVSACSGHGFKYAPAIARRLVDTII